MDNLLETAESELKEVIENLKARLRESERLCALESLRYEELLLELESSRMRQKYEGVEESSFEPETNRSNNDTSINDLRHLVSLKGHFSAENTSFRQSLFDPPQYHDWLVFKSENLKLDEEWAPSRKVSAPRGIALEKQLTHSVIVSWRPPDFGTHDTGEEVTAYHVYVDGQFRASVGGHEKCRALVENVDASKQHRISIRTVTGCGQSKDAECTLLVGKGSIPAPTRLKTSHITTNSVKLSWLPGSSNFYHAVYLNEHELRICPPGVYKIFLTGLPPNTLYRVRVEARRSGAPNDLLVNSQGLKRTTSNDEVKRNSVTTEFHTAPIGLPDPPKNVQVEAGPQDGILLISWRPVPQATHVLPDFENEPLVQGYVVSINDQPLMEVPGVESDHVLLPLRQLATLLKSPEFNQAMNRRQNHSLTPRLPPTRDEDSAPSTGDSISDLHNEDEETNEDRADCKVTPPRHGGQLELWLTVKSTLAANMLPPRGKKDASGPASPQIRLIPNLLLIAAGSLEVAMELFGRKLSKRLGLNENNAATAGVSLRRAHPVYISVERPGMDAERSDNADSEEDNPGIVRVHARNIIGTTKNSSPTSDALDSAEALLRERQLQKNRCGDVLDERKATHQLPYHRQNTWISGYQPTSYPYRHTGVSNFRQHYDQEPSSARLSENYTNYSYLRRTRPSRQLRVTRSMSDDNDYHRSRGKPFHYAPYSTESTESERHHLSSHYPSEQLFSFTKSSLDLRGDDAYRRGGRCTCRWYRSPPPPQGNTPKAPMLRRSKSLGRPYTSALISSSSNDEGISKAYFQRLHERLANDRNSLSRAYSRSRQPSKSLAETVASAVDYNSTDGFWKGRMGVAKALPGKQAPRHWLQEITYVPEIHLGRGYVDSDGHSRRYRHTWDTHYPHHSEHPHCQHQFNGNVQNRQRSRRSWKGNELNDFAMTVERDEREVNWDGEHFLDKPVESVFNWSEGLTYSEMASRNRKARTSDLPSRSSARRPKVEMDYRTRESDRKNVKGGTTKRRTQSENRRPLSSPSLRPSTASTAGGNGSYLVSLYDYDPAIMSPNPGAVEDELPFKEGDIIKVYGDCDEDGFYFGECNGLKGLVPSNMVCEATASEIAVFLRRHGGVGDKEQPSHKGRLSKSFAMGDIILPPGQMNKPHRAVGQHTGPPNHHTNRTLYSPNTIHSSGERPGRGRESRRTDHRGCERRCREPSGVDGERKRTSNTCVKSRQKVMEALYDYDPQIYSPNVDVETELKFRAGDRILILSEMDEDGFYVGELETSGRRGLVPSNFLREIPIGALTEGSSRMMNGKGSGDGEMFDSRRKTYPISGNCRSGVRGARSSNARCATGSQSRQHSEEADLEPGSSGRVSNRAVGSLLRQSSGDGAQENQVEDDLDDGEERLEGEDSIITATVPPATNSSPLEWKKPRAPLLMASSGSAMHLSPGLIQTGPALASRTQAIAALLPTTLVEPLSSNRGFLSGGDTSTADLEGARNSPESDGQGDVIFMDINSKKGSKNRKLTRNSSNEQSHDQGENQVRRRSVFRSPFKKNPQPND